MENINNDFIDNKNQENNKNSIKWCNKCKDEKYHSKFHILCNLTRKHRNKK